MSGIATNSRLPSTESYKSENDPSDFMFSATNSSWQEGYQSQINQVSSDVKDFLEPLLRSHSYDSAFTCLQIGQLSGRTTLDNCCWTRDELVPQMQWSSPSIPNASLGSAEYSMQRPHLDNHDQNSFDSTSSTEQPSNWVEDIQFCCAERRREQNRASQRRFRANKEARLKAAESRVKDLEEQLAHLIRRNDMLEQERSDLQTRIDTQQLLVQDRLNPFF